MPPPIAPPLLPPRRPRRRGRRAHLGGTRRRAAVVTSALLLSACAAPNPGADASETRGAPTWTASVPPRAETPQAEAPRPEAAPVTPAVDTEAEGTPIGEGEASYYGAELAGNPTASGEPFDPSALTAAHRTLPFGTRVRVTNVRTGASVVVRINDRGPFHGDRVIDLSRAAADAIGLTQQGVGTVRMERLPAARGTRG
ncbi:MAG: septal ring lytic transglycosylase RlpA family protein [Bacteroidota bacterium]